ncbi:unnamed protein product [Paramecium primaurelia]|uniref:Protein kinase domain-containing protein n=1 Tax=Paramecium primaurelia TaxID=5886 RepID=A0A8S1M0A4_PARPR|nr:unnamed protein product [Paramecium primaurelia]
MNIDIKVIGDYEVNFGAFIGKGSYGKVYEGRIVSQNRKICVKVLQLTEEKRPMFQREVDILEEIKKITHPNILKIYHIVEQNQIIYIFMEQCKENLEQKLQKMKKENKIFSIDQVLHISKQVCKGYKEIMKKNIIHRDIKPENILIGEDGYYKISDYGLSKTQTDVESLLKQTQLGTPLFVSPQVFQGKYSNKADLFSFGLTIYYITFQQPIFQIKSIGDLEKEFNRIKNGIKLPIIKNEGDQNSKNNLEYLLKMTIQYEEDDRMSWDQLYTYLDEININSQIHTIPKLEDDKKKAKNDLEINQYGESVHFYLEKIKQIDINTFTIKPVEQVTDQTQKQSKLQDQTSIENNNQAYQNNNQAYQNNNQAYQNTNQAYQNSNSVYQNTNQAYQNNHSGNQNNNSGYQNNNQVYQNNNQAYKNSNSVYENNNSILQWNHQINNNQGQNNNQIPNSQKKIQKQQLDSQENYQQIPKDFINQNNFDSKFVQSQQEDYQNPTMNPNIIKQNTNSSQSGYQIQFHNDFQEEQDSKVYNQIHEDKKLNLDNNNKQDQKVVEVKQQNLLISPNQQRNNTPQQFQQENQVSYQNFFANNQPNADESMVDFNKSNLNQDSQLIINKNQQIEHQFGSQNQNPIENHKDNQIFIPRHNQSTSIRQQQINQIIPNDKVSTQSLNEIDAQSEILSNDTFKLSFSTQKEDFNQQGVQNSFKQTSKQSQDLDQVNFDQVQNIMPSSIKSQTQQKNQINQLKDSNKNKIITISEIIPQNKDNNQINNQQQQTQQTQKKQYAYKAQQQIQEPYQAQQPQQDVINKKQQIQSQDVQKQSFIEKQILQSNEYVNNNSNQYQQQKVQQVQNQNQYKKMENTDSDQEFGGSNDKQPNNQQLIQQQVYSNQNNNIQNSVAQDTQQQGQITTKLKGRLIKKADANQPAQSLKQVFQIILQKIKLAENVFNSYQKLKTHQKLQNFIKQFEIFNYLLYYYQYSLITNVKLFCKNDRNIDQCYLKKDLDQFIDENTILDYQKYHQQQINEITQIYEQKLAISTRASKDLQDFLDSRNNNGDMLDLIRFLEQGNFYKYNSYIELYEKYFKQIFGQLNCNLNSKELLIFFGYSIKFIKIEKEFPLKNYKIINSNQIDYLSDDEECLKEFIIGYMNIK